MHAKICRVAAIVLTALALHACSAGGMSSGLKVGETAPDFTVTTLDGETVSLASLKGKYVLVDFWATWCGPCIGEMPHLKEVWEQHKDKPNFAFVGISLDDDKAALEQYVKDEKLGWKMAHLGGWDHEISDAYKVAGIPEILLIDPTGKVAAAGLRGDGIAEAVSQAVGS